MTLFRKLDKLVSWSLMATAILTTGSVNESRADDLSDRLSRIAEQNAAFESFQVNRRFFICVVEAANANLTPATEAASLAESAACLRSLLARDATFDSDGLILEGEDAIVDIATGLLADVRQNVSFTLESPLVLRFVPGRFPGTGEITVSFTIDVTQEVITPGPFGNILGGQVAKFRNQMTLRAVRPQEWRIHELVVRSLSLESGLDLQFADPFPRFPQIFPRQRGAD